jgi:hypothetical protein
VTVYKFRAESLDDVVELLHRIAVDSYEILSEHPPDVVVTIAQPSVEGRALTLDQLRSVAAEMANGHLVRETLAQGDRYTGARGLIPAKPPD